jgi:hypothetical protein
MFNKKRRSERKKQPQPRRPAQKSKLQKGDGASSSFPQKSWKLVKVVGSAVLAILAVLGALVTWWPHLTIEALKQADPRVAPFSVTNSGRLTLENVHAFSYVVREVTPHGLFYNNLISTLGFSTDRLHPGESKTACFEFTLEMPTEADVAVIVDYRVFGFKFREISRFVGYNGPIWQWMPEPTGDIKKAVDEDIRIWEKMAPK